MMHYCQNKKGRPVQYAVFRIDFLQAAVYRNSFAIFISVSTECLPDFKDCCKLSV